MINVGKYVLKVKQRKCVINFSLSWMDVFTSVEFVIINITVQLILPDISRTYIIWAGQLLYIRLKKSI